MPTTSKYFVLTPNANDLNFLDFDLSYGNGSITTVGESIQFNGSPMVDSVFVRPGLTYDLSSTAGSPDKIYLTGNLSDYQLSTDSSKATLTLSRTVGGLGESVTVSAGTLNTYDKLVFANGTVNAYMLYIAAKTGSAAVTPVTSETSLAPMGAAAPGAHLEATIKAFSSNPAAAGQVGETFASVRPGINYIVNGGNGIDTVYVADGSKVDATLLGQSVDLVYMRGKWSDYAKSLQTDGTVLHFTRQINGVTESVKVDAGTVNLYDRLIFADGSVTTYNAKNAIFSNANAGIEVVKGYNANQTTPQYSDAEIAAALGSIRDAAENNNATATSPAQQAYKIAGVTGVTPDNLGAINSALNSALVDRAHTDTAPEVQAVVNAYNAILASADGKGGNTPTALTGDQYAAVGVTGVSGSAAPAAGSALHLLDDVVDRSARPAVDTELELQQLQIAAKSVQAQAAGAAGLTMAQLGLLGVNDQNGVRLDGNVHTSSQKAILAKIAAAADNGTGTDTLAEIQALVNSINHAPVIANPTANAAAGGLFFTKQLAGTAVTTPTLIDGAIINGNTGATVPGWAISSGTPDINDYNNSLLSGSYVLSNLNGTSLNGGSYAEFISDKGGTWAEGMRTDLTGLTPGQTYVFGVQWQQFTLNGFGLHSGGQLVVSVNGVERTYADSLGLSDGWQNAFYQFTASGSTASLGLRINGAVGVLSGNGNGAIAVDSLSAQQIEQINTLQGTGATTSAVFGTVSDADPGAALKGWAITRAAADSSGHHWQYSSNNGASWANMDGASASQAIYLASTDLVRWTGFKGSNTELDAKAVDDTGPTLHAANAAATLVDTSISGGSSAFSGNTAVLSALAMDISRDMASSSNQAVVG